MLILAAFSSSPKKSYCKTRLSQYDTTRLPWTRKRSLAVDLILAFEDRVAELQREGKL